MAITNEEFDYISHFVEQRTGIVLEKGKEYLVEGRLMPLVRKEGQASLTDLIERLKTGALAEPLARRVCEAMTTNETSFFRDVHPFEVLKNHVLPPLIDRRRSCRELNIWCAASSTGQEPYTIAMILMESFPELKDWKIWFLATDIATDVLNKARSGRFTQLEVNRGLPANLLVKYFKREGMEWEISPQIRKLIDFREMNINGPWVPMPRLDLIFMRNILIYFSVETKRQILGKARKLLRDDGGLFLGGAETTLNIDSSYERVPYDRSGFYRPLARLAA